MNDLFVLVLLVRPNSYILNYNFYTSRSTVLADSIHDKQQKHALDEKTQGVVWGLPAWGMGTEDIVVLWVWGFCGDSHRFFCGYGMGIGIEIQCPQQPCYLLSCLLVNKFQF